MINLAATPSADPIVSVRARGGWGGKVMMMWRFNLRNLFLKRTYILYRTIIYGV